MARAIPSIAGTALRSEPVSAQPIVKGLAAVALARALDGIGLSSSMIFDHVGLPAPSAIGHNANISLALIIKAANIAARETGRDDLGVLFGEALARSPPSTIAMAFRTQASLSAALKAIANQLNTRNPTIVHEINDDGELIVWRVRTLTAELRNNRFLSESVLASIVFDLRGFLGKAWRPEQTLFTFEQPPDSTALRRHFGTVLFDAEFDALIIPRADLAPLFVDETLGQSRGTLSHLAPPTFVGGGSVLDLEDLTLRLTTEGRCTVGELADACGLQRRSLQRRLDSIGLSFVELVERARRDLVTGLLRDSARPIADVAVTLGFQSSSTFARWFKANYGATARDYRAKATFIDPAERLRSIVDGLEDLVVSVDPTGQIVYANTRAEETLYRSQSVVGAQMRDLVYPGDADWLRAAMEIKGLLERDTLGEAACRLCVGVGGYEDFRARVRLLSDARGNPAKILFIFRAAAPRPTGT